MSQTITPELPLFKQPSGIVFYLSTWTGRIIIVNTLVFLAMAILGGFWFPNEDLLLSFGAKDPVLLAKGEYWRLLTPVFVHIGFLHFFMNNLGLYYVGYQLERFLGTRWFLGLYLFSGVMGNIASAVFSLSLSAGASGALFGLLGCGYFIERALKNKIETVTGYKVRSGIYTSMMAINIVFGFVVPGIDNAAHIGGLIAGYFFTYVMYRVRPNQLYGTNLKKARLVILLLTTIFAIGLALATSPSYTLARLQSAGAREFEIVFKNQDKLQAAQKSYYYLTQSLKIDADNLDSLVLRGKLLYITDHEDEAIQDLRLPLANTKYVDQLKKFSDELRVRGKNTWALDRVLDYNR